MRTVRHALPQQRGFTLIEVMVATLVLVVGILALLTSFDSAQQLTLTSERRAALVHRAQRTIERIETYSYEDLAMTSIPVHSTEEGNPDYYVDYAVYAHGEPAKCTEVAEDGCYAWNAKATSEEAAIAVAAKGECSETVTAECGIVSVEPEKWSSGNVSGETYSFVTWASDPVCKEEVCPGENDYKRITVVVTANVPGGTHPITPVRVSTLIANPNAAPKEGTPTNPLQSPGTTCINAETGAEERCTRGITQGVAKVWFLHDSAAKLASVSEPTASHTTHPTVAPSKPTSCGSTEFSGCPAPDAMTASPPTASDLYDYSTDQDGLVTITPPVGSTCPGVEPGGAGTGCYGGRALERAAANCGTEPSESEEGANFRSEMWVTPPLEAETTLTGSGGLSIYTQTLNGVVSPVTLCVAVYRVPEDLEDLWATSKTTPTVIASTSYTPSSGEWPTSLEQVSFIFEPTSNRKLVEPAGATVGELGGQPVLLKAGERIGLRVWAASTSGSGISLIYGTGGHTETIEGVETEVARYPAIFQLNTE